MSDELYSFARQYPLLSRVKRLEHKVKQAGVSNQQASNASSAPVGTPVVVPQTGLSNVSQAQVVGLSSALSGLAPLANPAFTGTPTAPTAAPGTNTTQIATTAFVQSVVPASGITAARPSSPPVGFVYFDTSFGYPVWWDGSGWIHPDGTAG